ncbi:MAG: hypothetical protein AB7U38_05300 [Hyphomicrobiales bacterium]
MVILVRYAFLLALGLGAIFTFVSATAVTGQMLLAGTGTAVQDPSDMSLWVMVAMGGMGLLSLFRHAFVRAPARARLWYRDHRESLATLIVVGGVFFAFMVL